MEVTQLGSHEAVIFVPSRYRNGSVIAESERRSAEDRVTANLAQLFRGSTRPTLHRQQLFSFDACPIIIS